MSASLGKIEAPKPQLPGVLQAIQFTNPLADQFKAFCVANRKRCAIQMARRNAFPGESLALCAPGPALADAIRDGALEGFDQVWACNSAVTYLADHGVRVDGAVGIDQTLGLKREWARVVDTTYYVASSVHPETIAHLVGKGARLRWFHNACGIPNELSYYRRQWPRPSCVMSHGANVCPRTIGLAFWMGFATVDVFGANCALGDNDVAHANGESATDAYGAQFISQGVIDGRVWRTRPDMLLAAVDLARFTRTHPVTLHGDTLANALVDKDDGFLDLVMRRIRPGEPLPRPMRVDLVAS